MINRKDSAVHMRYMVATALLMIGPGLGRALMIFGEVPFPLAIATTFFVADSIAILFLLNDILKRNNIKPFLTITTILIIHHLCWVFQDAGWWQSISKWFVTSFF